MEYDVTSPSGKTYVVTAPDGANEQEVLAYAQAEFEKLEPAKPAMSMAPMSGGQEWLRAGKNVAQGLGHLGTSVTGGLVGQVAGLGALGYDITANALMAPFGANRGPGEYADPTAVQERVSNALTYTPENADTLTMKTVQAPGKMIMGAGDFLAEQADKTELPYVGSVARGIPLAVASALGAKAGMPATAKIPAKMQTPVLAGERATKIPVPAAVELPKIAGATPAERAENFVRTRTNLDFDRLSADFKRRLTEVAATARNLESLDATAIERQGLLASLERPIENPTRGQVTRDPLQQRTEQLAKATDAGAPLREIDLAQNKALLDNLEVLRERTGARAAGDLQTGKSVQEALRGRHAIEKLKVRKLYDEAEKAGEAQGAVNIDSLVDYLKTHEDPTRVSYAAQKLKALGAITEEATDGISVSQARPLTFKELEGIRKAAVANKKSADGTTRHYAEELAEKIDEVMASAGGEAGAAYTKARAARKAVGDEFERQAAVSRLVKNNRMSRDRAVALEDTWSKTVKSGSLEELQAVRKSLEASPNGAQAWADLKAATVDYIRDRATGGGLGLKNELGDSHATWAGLKRAVDDIGPDKLREIFGEADAKRIETLVDAAQILKTEAPMGIKGSPTVDKILTFIDKLGKVPGLGKASELTGGAIKLAEKAKNIGKAGRDVRRAQTTPLDEMSP